VLSVVVLLIAAVWWVFHIPFDADRVQRAIPPDVTLLSEHHELGGRWPTLARNPLLLAAAGYTNAADAAQAGAPLDPALCRLLRFTAPRYTLTAWSPHEQAWIAVSWLGWRSQLLRFALTFRLVRGFEPVRDGGPLRSWRQPAPPHSAGRYLSIGVADGVLTVARSNDSETALRLLLHMEYTGAPAPAVQRRLQSPWHASDKDRAWIQWDLADGGNDGRQELALSVATADERRTVGWFRLSGAEPMAGLSTAPAAMDCWDLPLRILPDRPVMAMLMRPDSARPLAWLNPYLRHADRVIVRALENTAAELPACFVAVLGNELSGRILSLRVPSIVVGWRLAPHADVTSGIKRVLDAFNAVDRLGLVARETRLAGRPATVIDSSQEGILAGMEIREKPVLMVEAGWLLAASCAESLERLLLEQRPPAFPGRPAWRIGEREGSPASVFVDAAGAEQSLRHALAVYELSLQMEGGRAAQQERQRLNDIRFRLAALARAGDLTITAASRGAALEGRFSTAPAASE